MRTGADARGTAEQDLFLDSVCYTRVPLKSRVPEVVPQMGIHVLLPLFTHSTPRRVYIYLPNYLPIPIYLSARQLARHHIRVRTKNPFISGRTERYDGSIYIHDAHLYILLYNKCTYVIYIDIY